MLWWIAQNLLFAALLAGIVRLACTSRRLSPAARHALWLVVLVKLLTPPLLVWPWPLPDPFPRVNEADETTAAATDLPAFDSGAFEPAEYLLPIELAASPPTSVEPEVADSPATVDAAPAPAPPAETIPLVGDTPSPRRAWTPWIVPALAGLWLAGSLAVALLQAVRVLRMSRRLRESLPADETLARHVAEIAARLRVRTVPVRVVPGLDSPLVWAVSRPVLLWPARLPANLPPDSLRGLIVHELAHVRRRDHWVGWLELAAACLWWWNPLAWYVRHQLRENAELACDGWVVAALPGGRRAYAEALLAVCESLSRPTPPLPAVGVSTGGRRTLERRLTMILRGRIPVRLSRGGLLAVLLLALGALPAWSQRPPEDESGLHTETIEQSTQPAFVSEAVAAEPPPPTGQSDGSQPYATDPPVPTKPLGIPTDASRANEAGLPADARQLLTKFEEDQSEIRREAERKLAERREELFRRLKELQDQYTRDAKLDEAVAIRDRIRQLRQQPQPVRTRTTAPRGTVAPPGDVLMREPDYRAMLWDHRHLVGESLVLRITGEIGGQVWGSDVYTSDSHLPTAAVHAGVLKPGETGVLRVTILQAPDSYEGSTRHGVASESYGDWPAAYRVERHDESTPADPTEPRGGTSHAPKYGSILWELRDRVGESFHFNVVGQTGGHVWGTGVYTSDSFLPAAALHAGVLKKGQIGTVRVTVLAGQDSYEGSTRRGVTSRSHGPWPAAFRVERVEDGADTAAAWERLEGLRGRRGETFEIAVTGTTGGWVWGTDVYTDDSDLGTAAVHAGKLQPGQRGVVRVKILPGFNEYQGSTRNGINSRGHGGWGSSYSIESVQIIEDAAEPRGTTAPPIPALGPQPADQDEPPKPGSEDEPGEARVIDLTGSTAGMVWGTEVYTADSDLSAAAVHAGILKEGQRGRVRVIFTSGRNLYAGTTRHGVTSQSWDHPWQRSFRMEPADNEGNAK